MTLLVSKHVDEGRREGQANRQPRRHPPGGKAHFAGSTSPITRRGPTESSGAIGVRKHEVRDELPGLLRQLPGDGSLGTPTTSLTSSGGEPLDKNYSTSDITKGSVAYLKKDAKAFYESNWKLWVGDNTDKQAGHDFWLTRNGHGAGFWDGDYEKGDELTSASKPYGEEGLYVSRGKIHSYHEPRRTRTRSKR